MQTSANYGLKLFEGSDNVKRQDFVDNFQKIDSVLKATNDKLGDSVKKDGIVQTGLNAEMVGGKHASDLINLTQLNTNCVNNGNIDNITDGGFSHYFNATGSMPSGYTSGDNDFVILTYQLDLSSHNWMRQTLWDIRTTNIFTRDKNNGIWTNWKRLLNEDDYNSLFQFASNGKNSIANAVAGKGVNANGGMTFDQLASAITNTSVLKYSSGTVAVTNAYFKLPIQNFTVLSWLALPADGGYNYSISSFRDKNNAVGITYQHYVGNAGTGDYSTVNPYYIDGSNYSRSPSGVYTGIYNNTLYNWYAIGY